MLHFPRISFLAVFSVRFFSRLHSDDDIAMNGLVLVAGDGGGGSGEVSGVPEIHDGAVCASISEA